MMEQGVIVNDANDGLICTGRTPDKVCDVGQSSRLDRRVGLPGRGPMMMVPL